MNFNKVFLTTLQSYNSWRYYIGFWETGSFDVKEYWENAQEEFKQETGKEIVEFVDFADASNMDYYDQKVGEYIKGNFGRIVGVQLYRMALQTFDGRYFNYISEMYTGHTYTKGYSQMLASENKWQFIKSAPELFLGSLITFFIFLNSLVFFIYFFFKRHTLAIKKESVAPIIFLGLLIIYFLGTGAPGNTERYIMPILVIEYVFLAYMLVNFKNLFKKI